MRNMLPIAESRRSFGVMPLVAGGVMGVERPGFSPANEDSGYPTQVAMALLFDSKTGVPLP